jgi:PAS domain S-box-containing protein
MRNFFHSITFRFWIPFAILPVVILSVVAYYYPQEQKRVLVERKRQALREAAQTVALGVELSVDFEDLNGVKKTIEFIKKNSDFNFVGVIIRDSATKTEQLLATFPEGKSFKEVSIVDSSVFIFQDFPFKSKYFSGYIRVAEDLQKIDEEVKRINKPVYLFILISLPFFLTLLLLISRTLTRPLLKLTNLVRQSKEKILDQTIPLSDSKSEIGELQNVFAELVETIQYKNKENVAILNNQELLVKARTLELEQAREKLIISQRRAKLGHYEVDLSSGNWESSQTLDEMLGIENNYPRSGSGMENLIIPEFRDEILSFFRKDNSETFLEKEIQLVHQGNGDSFWVKLVGEKKYAGSRNNLIVTGIIQNISEQKKYQEEIQRLSYVAEYTSNCVIIADKTKKIIWVNNSLLKLTGYQQEEVIGNTPAMFQFEKTDLNTISYINSKLANHEIISKVEILNRGKNGNEYWLELNIVPILNVKKEVSGYIAVETDITLRKQYEEGLRSINKNLEKRVQESVDANIKLSRAVNDYEKMAAIGEMAAGVAHDLNTPMSTIMVGAETLQYVISQIFEDEISSLSNEEWQIIRQVVQHIKPESFITGMQLRNEKSEMLVFLNQQHTGKSEETLKKLSDLLVKCRLLAGKENDLILRLISFVHVERMLRMIEHIQTINTIITTITGSVGKSTSVIKNLRSYIKNEETEQWQPVFLYENISSVLNMFGYDLLQSHQVSVSIEKHVSIEGSEIKLFQLWSNLIKNAIEAMKDQENKQLSVYTAHKEGKIIVSFENNGPVIPAGDLDKIFKLFYSTKEKQGGSGLGLSIVKRIVQEHRGSIEVVSIPDKTSFNISFPSSKTH